MTTQFQIYIGTDTRNRLPLAEVRQCIFDQAIDAFPHGHSIREEMGRYTHTDGEAVTERTVVVTWTADTAQVRTGEAHKRVSTFAGRCKALCLQESVMIETAVVDRVFV